MPASNLTCPGLVTGIARGQGEGCAADEDRNVATTRAVARAEADATARARAEEHNHICPGPGDACSKPCETWYGVVVNPSTARTFAQQVATQGGCPSVWVVRAVVSWRLDVLCHCPDKPWSWPSESSK